MPVFKDRNDEYIFVSNLGEGVQGVAQLVLHIQTGEYRVRKAFNFEDPTSDANNEAHVLHILQAKASEIKPRPNIVTFHGSSPGVVYLGFCNGGDLSELPDDAPASVVFRVVAQVLRSQVFMNESGVAHNDLHGGNIFAHYPEGACFPELYVGDFGQATAQRGPVSKPNSDLFFASERLEEIKEQSKQPFVNSDLQTLIDEAAALNEEADEQARRDEHMRAMQATASASHPEEAASAYTIGARLSRLLDLAEKASAKNPMHIRDLQYFRRPDTPSITYFDSVEACMESDIELQGPFQMAEVQVDANGVFRHLVRIDEKICSIEYTSILDGY